MTSKFLLIALSVLFICASILLAYWGGLIAGRKPRKTIKSLPNLMKLDRNITNPRRGKYALIKLRSTTLNKMDKETAIASSTKLMVPPQAVDFGDTFDTDFFVIRLKDKYAGPALHAYAQAAMEDDLEYAAEVDALAQAADRMIPKRIPD